MVARRPKRKPPASGRSRGFGYTHWLAAGVSLSDSFFQRPYKGKGFFGQTIDRAGQDGLTADKRAVQRDELPQDAAPRFGAVEGLGEEAIQPARPVDVNRQGRIVFNIPERVCVHFVVFHWLAQIGIALEQALGRCRYRLVRGRHEVTLEQR